MMRKTIAAAAVLLAFGLWASSAQAVELDLTSLDDGQDISPGDWVEMTVTVTNETDTKDIVHIGFDLIVEVGGETPARQSAG